MGYKLIIQVASVPRDTGIVGRSRGGITGGQRPAYEVGINEAGVNNCPVVDGFIAGRVAQIPWAPAPLLSPLQHPWHYELRQVPRLVRRSRVPERQ